MGRVYNDTNVLDASRKRISFVFDKFEKICVSFSGGKDSSVMTHLVIEEAKKRNRKVGLLFIDWECQFNLTIDHIRDIYKEYWDHIEPYWVCLPIKTDNSFSMIEPEFTAWDENKKHFWVRQKEDFSINDSSELPFHYDGMTFEEFTPEFNRWYSEGKTTAFFVGIRTQESLNRYRAIARDKDRFKGMPWSTNVVDDSWNVYPIYDWKTTDIWAYLGKYKRKYTKLYDRMYQAGVPLGSMRIDEPFGDTQRSSLWLYQVVEPETWGKMVARIAGVNTAGLYGNERGRVMGNGNKEISLPDGHTWKTFAQFLLNTMPPKTSEHYKNKIAVYLKWYEKKGYKDDIPDNADEVMEQKLLAPSWKLICKTMLRNDYWCRWLGFSPTKTSAYTKYQDLMKRRRKDWNIFPEVQDV